MAQARRATSMRVHAKEEGDDSTADSRKRASSARMRSSDSHESNDSDHTKAGPDSPTRDRALSQVSKASQGSPIRDRALSTPMSIGGTGGTPFMVKSSQSTKPPANTPSILQAPPASPTRAPGKSSPARLGRKSISMRVSPVSTADQHANDEKTPEKAGPPPTALKRQRTVRRQKKANSISRFMGAHFGSWFAPLPQLSDPRAVSLVKRLYCTVDQPSTCLSLPMLRPVRLLTPVLRLSSYAQQ